MNNNFIKLKNYKSFFLLNEEDSDDLRLQDPRRTVFAGSEEPKPLGTKQPDDLDFYFWNVPPEKEQIAKNLGLKQYVLDINDPKKIDKRWGYIYEDWVEAHKNIPHDQRLKQYLQFEKKIVDGLDLGIADLMRVKRSQVK